MSLPMFEFNGHSIKVENIDGIFWFNAVQLCKALGYKNATQTLNDNVRAEYTKEIRDSKKGGRPPRYLSESGLFQLLAKCNRPVAQEFQRWLYEDALPNMAKGKPVETPMPLVCFKDLTELYNQAIKGEIATSHDRFKILDIVTLRSNDGNQRCQILSIAGSVIEVRLEDGTHEFVKDNLLCDPIPYVRKPRTQFKTDLFREDLKQKSRVKAIYLEEPSGIRA